MAIQGLSNIETVLAQMRVVAAAASGPAGAPEASGTGRSFAAELQQSLRQVSAMQNSAAALGRAFELGVPGVSLANVMIDTQKAGIAFQAALQARNRLVAAYQEIASMPV